MPAGSPQRVGDLTATILPGRPTDDCSSLKKRTFGLRNTTAAPRASCSPLQISRSIPVFSRWNPFSFYRQQSYDFTSPPSGRRASTAPALANSSPDGTNLLQNAVEVDPDGKYFVFLSTHNSSSEVWILPEKALSGAPSPTCRGDSPPDPLDVLSPLGQGWKTNLRD